MLRDFRQPNVKVIAYRKEFPRDLRNLQPPGFNDPDDIREVPGPLEDKQNGTGSDLLPG